MWAKMDAAYDRRMAEFPGYRRGRRYRVMKIDPHCYRCGEALPAIFELSSTDGWCWENVAPGAASGGTMKPVHWRCSVRLKMGWPTRIIQEDRLV
jgi:hypothetical protein